MRTLIDAMCPGCGEIHVDLWADTSGLPYCQRCSLPLVRHHRSFGHVKADSIPGGLYIEHGLCHSDGTPRRFDSHGEIAKEAKRRGFVNLVEHVGDHRGSDKSAHTQRFV